jgi:DNA (cytosine-5)-methyltransferase 1
MRFGSVCSGIEAASAAFTPLGWAAAWLSEIEPFPSALLAYRFPSVPNLGNMLEVAGKVDRREIEAPDLLCGGCPCQSFSVAGLRGGLNDDRGNLTLEFIRIADAIDRVRLVDGKRPAWVLYENVPGILSDKTNAFGSLLGGLCGHDDALVPSGGKWTTSGVVAGRSRAVAWRVLDAQYFGVAQRRRRVFVLALGGADRWSCADALLPIGEGMRRHPAPRREARQEVAGTISARTTGGGGLGTDFDLAGGIQPVAGTLSAASGRQRGGGQDPGMLVSHTLKADPWASEDGTGRGIPLVPYQAFGGNNTSGPIDVATACLAHTSAKGDFESETFLVSKPLLGKGNSSHDESKETYIPVLSSAAGLIAFHGSQDPISSSDVTPSVGRNQGQETCIAFAENSRSEIRLEGGDGNRTGALSTGGGKPGQGAPMIAYTTKLHNTTSNNAGKIFEERTTSLDANSPPPVVFAAFKGGQGSKAGGIGYSESLAPTLGAAQSGTQQAPALLTGMQVRRLMPIECERLQGFSDSWTFMPTWNGWRKMGSDETPESCALEGLEVKQNKKTGKWRVKDVDGPRYKAIGNSWAVPVASWVGQRIQAVEEISARKVV